MICLGLTELKLFQRELVTPKMQGSAGVDGPTTAPHRRCRSTRLAGCGPAPLGSEPDLRPIPPATERTGCCPPGHMRHNHAGSAPPLPPYLSSHCPHPVRSVSLAGWASVSPSQCPVCGRGRYLCLRHDAGGNLVVQNELRLKTSEPGMSGNRCSDGPAHIL